MAKAKKTEPKVESAAEKPAEPVVGKTYQTMTDAAKDWDPSVHGPIPVYKATRGVKGANDGPKF